MPIVLRSEKASALTQQEMDGNFTVARNSASNVSTLQNDVANTNGALATLQTEVDAVEAAVSALQPDVGTLQTDVAAIQSAVSTIQADIAGLLHRLYFPGTLFAPGFTSDATYQGAANFPGGHTIAAILFPSGQTGIHDAGLSVQVPPNWEGRTIEVWLEATSHLTSLPIGGDYRLQLTIENVDGIGDFPFTASFPQQSSVLVTTVTLDSSSGEFIHLGLRRDYDHVDDDGGNLYVIGVELRAV